MQDLIGLIAFVVFVISSVWRVLTTSSQRTSYLVLVAGTREHRLVASLTLCGCTDRSCWPEDDEFAGVMLFVGSHLLNIEIPTPGQDRRIAQ
jgi:hypothetical protein